MKVRTLEEDRDRDQLLCVSHYMDPLKEEKNEKKNKGHRKKLCSKVHTVHESSVCLELFK